MKFRLTVTVAVVAALVFASACNEPQESGDKTAQPGASRDAGGAKVSAPKIPAVGMPMPSFKFTTLDGETDSFENYRGKPLLVNFWATWCGPCREEIPDLVDFYRAHQDDGVEIISIGYQDTVEDELKFLETQEMPWVLGLDTSDLYGRWLMKGIPTTYFVDTQGKVTHIQLGAMSREMMESFAAPLF